MKEDKKFELLKTACFIKVGRPLTKEEEVLLEMAYNQGKLDGIRQYQINQLFHTD